MKRLTSMAPDGRVDLSDWPDHERNNLADPGLVNCGRIDVLLGANVWSRILQAAIYECKQRTLIAQCTRLGWVVFGGIQAPPDSIVGLIETHSPTNDELHDLLQRFWQMDAIEKKRIRSPEE